MGEGDIHPIEWLIDEGPQAISPKANGGSTPHCRGGVEGRWATSTLKAWQARLCAWLMEWPEEVAPEQLMKHPCSNGIRSHIKGVMLPPLRWQRAGVVQRLHQLRCRCCLQKIQQFFWCPWCCVAYQWLWWMTARQLASTLGSYWKPKSLTGFTHGFWMDIPLLPPSAHQGGIALFWRPNKSYKVEDWQVCRPNVILFTIVMGSQPFFVVGFYISPTIDLSTLQHIKQVWNKCPWGHTSILLGSLNINLRTPRDVRDEPIAKVVEDVMGLTDLSKHFHQRSRGMMRGR